MGLDLVGQHQFFQRLVQQPLDAVGLPKGPANVRLPDAEKIGSGATFQGVNQDFANCWGSEEKPFTH